MQEYFSNYMINLGDDASGTAERAKLGPNTPIPFEDMCKNIGTAMPARKAVKGPAPAMPRLAQRTYHEPHCDTASDWVSQLPLAMVATLIPSKKVHLYERQDVTGEQAIKKEYKNLEDRGCWDISKAEPFNVVAKRFTDQGTLIHILGLCLSCFT